MCEASIKCGYLQAETGDKKIHHPLVGARRQCDPEMKKRVQDEINERECIGERERLQCGAGYGSLIKVDFHRCFIAVRKGGELCTREKGAFALEL